MSSATEGKAARRWTVREFLRKMSALLLVLLSVTVGIVGLMWVTQGHWWGALLILATPFGIWLATRITPEGATTGYFDRNL
jgi:uncharacterized membrane protein